MSRGRMFADRVSSLALSSALYILPRISAIAPDLPHSLKHQRFPIAELAR